MAGGQEHGGRQQGAGAEAALGFTDEANIRVGGAVGPPAGDGAGRPGRDAEQHDQAEQEHDESPHGSLLLAWWHHCHLSEKHGKSLRS